MKREYYKIRILKNIGKYNEFHSSNNGTDQWGEIGKVKSILTRGIRGGYRGTSRSEFEGYEVVRFIETVQIKEEVVEL